MSLPTSIDASYPDRDAGDAAHQQHHDVIHRVVNDPATNWPEGNAAYEAKVSRTGATAGEVPTLQADNTLTFAAVAGGSTGGSDSADVSTTETTTSTTFTDLATVGPVATVDVGTSGKVLVIVGATIWNNTAGSRSFMGWAASGANTVAAADARALDYESGAANDLSGSSRAIVLEGLNAGSTTFTAKYKVSSGGGTGSFVFRNISVIPL